MQPKLFGTYLLLERISVGGMAEVFKARSALGESPEVLALKRILPEMAKDSAFVEMFVDEGRICGTLDHRCIARTHELGQVDGTHFMAMAYVGGVDLLALQNRLRKRGRSLPAALAAWVGSEVCAGLDYAHRRRDEQGRPLEIIHRDISPQNVLVSYAGEVKIIDFGIAKARARSAETRAGVLKGKFSYMSPEQARGQSIDHRSDIFAVGALLWELLAGARLFEGGSDYEILDKVRNGVVPKLNSRARGVPSGLAKIVHRALARRPDDRFPWASELGTALADFNARQREPFSRESLAGLLRGLFAQEWQHEQATMEAYRRLSFEELREWAKGAPRAQGAFATPEAPTQISAQDAPPELRPTPPASLPDQQTRILDDGAPDPRRAVAEQPTRILDEDVPPELPTETGGAVKDAEVIIPSSAAATLPPDGIRGAVPTPPRRGFPWTVVAVGILAAGVSALSGLLLLQRQRAPQTTLVISVSRGPGAEISIDGVFRGRCAVGRPLVLQGLKAGAHRVAFLGETPLAENVSLHPREPRIVRFEPPARGAAMKRAPPLRLLAEPGVWRDERGAALGGDAPVTYLESGKAKTVELPDVCRGVLRLRLAPPAVAGQAQAPAYDLRLRCPAGSASKPKP